MIPDEPTSYLIDCYQYLHNSVHFDGRLPSIPGFFHVMPNLFSNSRLLSCCQVRESVRACVAGNEGPWALLHLNRYAVLVRSSGIAENGNGKDRAL